MTHFICKGHPTKIFKSATVFVEHIVKVHGKKEKEIRQTLAMFAGSNTVRFTP